MSGSVLNLSDSPRVEGKGLLTRSIPGKDGKKTQIDMWADVLALDCVRLEAILKIAVTDSEYDLTHFIRMIEYQGFDREFYIRHCLSKMSVSLFCRFAILGAIRGSNFQRIVDTCEQMPQDMISGFSSIGFVKTPKKRNHITILRCTASIPHWCVFYLNKAGTSKKINVDCPAPLQFPGAASLPMSKEVRLQHIAFCVSFSSLLPGGQFKISIYMTAMSNQIPVSDIPADVLLLLKVSSDSESHRLTDEETKQFGSQVALKK